MNIAWGRFYHPPFLYSLASLVIYLKTSILHSSIPTYGTNPNCYLWSFFYKYFLSLWLYIFYKYFMAGLTTIIGRNSSAWGILGFALFRHISLAYKILFECSLLFQKSLDRRLFSIIFLLVFLLLVYYLSYYWIFTSNSLSSIPSYVPAFLLLCLLAYIWIIQSEFGKFLGKFIQSIYLLPLFTSANFYINTFSIYCPINRLP